MNRREFNQESLVALFSGVAITISGCGGGGGSPATPTPTAANPPSAPPPSNSAAGREGSITGNHGHQAILTSAEFGSSGGAMLNIQGQADHPHMLELTETELAAIQDGESVSKSTTSQEGHTHTVTFDSTDPMPDDY